MKPKYRHEELGISILMQEAEETAYNNFFGKTSKQDEQRYSRKVATAKRIGRKPFP